MTAVRTHTHAQAVDVAVDLFTRQGYEGTTVEEIADAAKVSRATFFRRFRSKEDVVFADHELLLEEVVVMLAATRPDARASEESGHDLGRGWDPDVDPYLEVCRAARMVFDHHVGQRETSLARYALLQQVPALRDRELITTHRYERAFTHYLRDTLPAERSASTASIAFAASVVAVHNSILRRWLRTRRSSCGPSSRRRSRTCGGPPSSAQRPPPVRRRRPARPPRYRHRHRGHGRARRGGPRRPGRPRLTPSHRDSGGNGAVASCVPLAVVK